MKLVTKLEDITIGCTLQIFLMNGTIARYTVYQIDPPRSPKEKTSAKIYLRPIDNRESILIESWLNLWSLARKHRLHLL